MAAKRTRAGPRGAVGALAVIAAGVMLSVSGRDMGARAQEEDGEDEPSLSAVSGVQVQNMSGEEAAVVLLEMAHQTDPPGLVQIVRPGVAAGAAGNMYAAGVSELQDGWFSAFINSDRPTATLVRTDWEPYNGAAAYTSPQPSMDTVIPLVVANYHGQSSVVVVQNTDRSAPDTVDVTIQASGETIPSAQRALTVPAGGSALIDVARDFPQLARDRAAKGGFVGSMRLQSAWVAAVSFVDVGGDARAVYAFEGVPAEHASRKLFAPMIRNRMGDGQGGEYTTGIAVTNPGEAAVDVRVTYTGSALDCAGQTAHEAPANIAPHANHVFYPPATQVLPTNCLGSAVIEASEPIIGVVVDARDDLRRAAAYALLSPDDAATRVLLPLARRRQTPLAVTTGYLIMNVGVAPAQVTATFSDSRGVVSQRCGPACSAVVPPFGTFLVYPRSQQAALPEGEWGSAVVTSDQPVVVIGSDSSEAGVGDMTAFNGIPVPSAAPGGPDAPVPSRAEGYVPFIARNWTWHSRLP